MPPSYVGRSTTHEQRGLQVWRILLQLGVLTGAQYKPVSNVAITHMRTAMLQTEAHLFDLQELESRVLLSTPWGPFPVMIKQDQAVADYPYVTGAGETVAEIDSGVDYQQPVFGGAIGRRHLVLTGYDFNTNSSTFLDDNGHGTGVAGIIGAEPYTFAGYYFQGVAPGVHLIALEEDNSAQVKEALDWVIANRTAYNITVVNLTDFQGGGFEPAQYNSELETLYNDGVVITTPVGNSGPNQPISLPASSPYVIGAGGVDLSGNVWYNDTNGTVTGTQVGPGLSILAPGADVTLPYYNIGPPAADPTTPYFTNYGTGTSWSSAYTAGTDALLKQIDPTLTPAEILSILQQSGVPVTDSSNGVTYPRLDIDAAIALTFQQRGDIYVNSNTIATAAPLKIKHGSVSRSDLRLLVGHNEVFSVDVTSSSDLSVNIQYSGSSAFPSAELLNSSGAVVTTVGSSGSASRLRAGTYYLQFTAPSPVSMIGTYGFSIVQSPLSTRRADTTSDVVSAPALAAFNATRANVFATAPIGSSSQQEALADETELF